MKRKREVSPPKARTEGAEVMGQRARGLCQVPGLLGFPSEDSVLRGSLGRDQGVADTSGEGASMDIG